MEQNGSQRKEEIMLTKEKKNLMIQISKILVSENQITPQEQMRMLELLQEG